MVGAKLGNNAHLEVQGKITTKVDLQHLVDDPELHIQSTTALCAEKTSYQATVGSNPYRSTKLMNLWIGWSC